jgi:NitT/TauT family transport system substrate-binding protein
VFGVDVYPSVVLYSTAPWLAAHRDVAQRLVRALTRTHPAEELRKRMPAEFRTEDADADLEGLRTTQAMLSLDGRITPESAAAVLKVLSVSLDEVRTASIDLSKTYTDEFLPVEESGRN